MSNFKFQMMNPPFKTINYKPLFYKRDYDDYNDCQNENRVVDKYYCKYCDAHLARKFNFDRHILTAKHLKFKNDYKIVINESGEKVFIKNEIFECKCGKTYKHSTNLIRHKKTNCVF